MAGTNERLLGGDNMVVVESTEDVDSRLEKSGHGLFQRRLLFVCGGTQFGAALEVLLLPFLPRVLHTVESPESKLHVEDEASEFAWLLSFVVFLGTLAGTPLFGLVADRSGRRMGMCMSSFCTGLFGLTSALAVTKVDLLASRFMVGFGLGGASCGLAFFTECLAPSKRQEQLVVFFLMFSIGSVACALIAWLCLGLWRSWRLLLLFACLPSVFVAFSFPWLPDSPYYLVTHGRQLECSLLLDEIDRVNQTTRVENDERNASEARGSDETDMFVNHASFGRTGTDERNRSEVYGQTGNESGTGSSARQSTKKTVLVLIVLFLLMAVVYYALVELTITYLGGEVEQDDLTNAIQYLEIVLVNFAEIPGLGVSKVIIERYDSKTSVTLMFALCGIFCLAMSANHALLRSDRGPGTLGTLLFFGARASALGFNQSLWIFSSVYFPTSSRALGVGMVTAFAKVGGLLSPFVGQVLFLHSQQAALLFCAVACMICCLLSNRMLPQM